jgi:hypothetical protein
MRQLDSTSLIADNAVAGIELSTGCLVDGVCWLDVNELLGIRQSHPDTSPNIFLQDITLAATTIIGTVLFISIISAAIMIIMGGAQGNENMASNGKKWMGYAVIGFLLVIFAYAIIKLVQFIAAG